MKPSNFIETLEELDAGIFSSKISKALSEVALGVVEQGKKGKLVITLSMDRIGESSQLQVIHKLNYAKPTLRGSTSEEDTTNTPMHVNKNGSLSVVPESQADLFKNISEV